MDQSFLGRGWRFPPRFTASGVAMVEGTEDIRESLRILISTAPGERVMQPTYGCGLKTLVFESINESVLTSVKETIRSAVLFFEPRVTLESVSVDTSRAHEGLLYIELVYTVRMTNSRTNIVFPFYFTEGTSIVS